MLVATIIFAWIFSGWPRIWQNPPIPPEIQEAEASTTNLVVTSCDINDVSDTTCYEAIIADDGSSDTLATKTEHLDAPFQTLSANSVNSATLYYDSWGEMGAGEDWWIYVKDTRDGATICSVDPAPEYASETTDSFDCSAITAAQLSAGVWLYIAGNDAKGPNLNNIEYIRLYVDYTPVVYSVTLDQETFSYGTMNNNTASSTLTLWSGAGIIATNGDTTAKFDIYGANTADWTLDAATSTQNYYTHKFCNETDNNCLASGPYGASFTALTTSPQLLKASVAPSGQVAFQLSMHTPNPSSVYTQQSAVVTVQASAP